MESHADATRLLKSFAFPDESVKSLASAMALNWLSVESFIGINVILDSVQSKGCVVYAVSETSDGTAEEAVSFFKGLDVSISHHNVFYLSISVRHADAHDTASIVSQIHGCTVAVDQMPQGSLLACRKFAKRFRGHRGLTGAACKDADGAE